MYFWKIDELVEALKEGRISAQQKKQYTTFFIAIVIISILSYGTLPEFNLFDYLDLGLFILINIIGTFTVYKINKNGDNQDFVFRYMSLTIPIFVRTFILYMVLLSLGYLLIAPFVPGLSLDETNLYDVFVGALTEIILYIMMIKCFKKINA